MSIIISSDGAENILKYLVGASTTTETVILKLYNNDISPNSITALADFVEVSGGGYAEKILNANTWTIDGNVATSSPQLFNFTSNVGQIYGYYLVGQTSGKLIASEKFTSGPFNIANSGDSITVTATISIS
jgi:hypothetical protein